jgi:hypothetical protein
METREGFMLDAQGRHVPVDMVSAVDKLRDQTVKSVMARIFAARDTLAKFKTEAWEEIHVGGDSDVSGALRRTARSNIRRQTRQYFAYHV